MERVARVALYIVAALVAVAHLLKQGDDGLLVAVLGKVCFVHTLRYLLCLYFHFIYIYLSRHQLG